jgi:CDP-glucose 4,6-dehydratase
VTSDKCYENREWVWGYRESEPMGGHDPYSNSKGCAELVTSAYRRSFFSSSGIGIASARAGNVIGGGDWALDRIIPDCIRALSQGVAIKVRNPRAVRPWQHVLEPLGGYLLLAEKQWEDPKRFSEGWNFGPEPGDARPVSWIADFVVSRWGKGARWEHVRSENEPHEAVSLRLDCSYARTKLGWAPRLDLRRTLEWTVDWYRQFGEGHSALDLALRQIENYEKLGEESNG